MRNTERARRLFDALPIATLVLCSVLTEPLSLLLFALSAMALHELGHIAVLSALGAGALDLRFVAFGLRITPRGRLLSHGEEAAVALSGPLSNLAAAAFSFFLSRVSDVGSWSSFLAINLLLAALNLLPISGFDGGRALAAALSHFVSPRAASTVVGAGTVTLAAFGCFFGLFLLMRGGGGLYIFSLSITLLLREIFARSSPL